MAFYVSDYFLSLCFLLCIIQPFWAKLDPIGYLTFMRVESLLRFRYLILFSLIYRMMGRHLILSFDPEYSDYRYLDVYMKYGCEVYCYLFIVVLIGRCPSEGRYWEKVLGEFQPSITLREVYQKVNTSFNRSYKNPLGDNKKEEC